MTPTGGDRAPDPPVVLVCGASAAQPPPGVEAVGNIAELRFAPDDEALFEAIGDADAIFTWRIDGETLARAWSRAAHVRWIQTSSDGVDDLLFPALVTREDVVVTNARGTFEEPIAEWAIGAMLSLATGLHRSIADQQHRRWDGDRHTRRLAGRHLLVVGPGPIGRATARRARALGMTVAAVGRHAREDDLFGRVAGPDEFHSLLASADVVLDALPLTAETRRRFDDEAFAAMRPGAWFVNVGRGATVDEPALVEALRAGRPGAAALDVFEIEPLPDASPLWSLPNVIVSPHISGDVERWETQVVDLFVDNVGRFVRGEPMRNLVDVRAGFGVG